MQQAGSSDSDLAFAASKLAGVCRSICPLSLCRSHSQLGLWVRQTDSRTHTLPCPDNRLPQGRLVLQISLQSQVLLCQTGLIPFGQSLLLMLHEAAMFPCRRAKSVWSLVLASCDWQQCLLTSLASQLKSGIKSSKHIVPAQSNFSYHFDDIRQVLPYLLHKRANEWQDRRRTCKARQG